MRSPPTTDNRGRDRVGPFRLRRHAVPALLVIVVAVQMIRVHAVGQSRWKGGGLGMYSDFHPRHYELWVYPADGPPHRYPSGAAEENRMAGSPLLPCLITVNERCLRDLRDELRLAGEDVARLQVWKPSFDPVSGTLRRILAVEVDDDDNDAR